MLAEMPAGPLALLVDGGCDGNGANGVVPDALSGEEGVGGSFLHLRLVNIVIRSPLTDSASVH